LRVAEGTIVQRSEGKVEKIVRVLMKENEREER
jgi:hypothetical protein